MSLVISFSDLMRLSSIYICKLSLGNILSVEELAREAFKYESIFNIELSECVGVGQSGGHVAHHVHRVQTA